MRALSPRMMFSTFGRLGDAERGRRLVHQHQLGRPVGGAGDRDALALAAGKVADRSTSPRGCARRGLHELLALADHAPAVEPAERAGRQSRGRGRGSCRPAAVGQRQVLEDDLDAACLRLAGSVKWTSSPSIRMRPAVGGYTPQMILTSVDLPAPLSPTSATTSPAWTSSEKSSMRDDAAELLADVLEAEDRRGDCFGHGGGGGLHRSPSYRPVDRPAERVMDRRQRRACRRRGPTLPPV